jgi:small nuclear ribonucleoprotein F
MKFYPQAAQLPDRPLRTSPNIEVIAKTIVPASHPPSQPPTTANMSFVPVNPRPMLQELVNKPVFVRLKWGQVEYKGTLVSVDSYMNLQLSGTEEYVSDKPTGLLGQVLIRYVILLLAARSKLADWTCSRCNNVLWVRGADGSNDAAMSG